MDYAISIDLKKRINFLETLVTKAPGLLYCKDLNGIYLGCNEVQAKIVGLDSVNDIVGKTDFDILDKNEAEKLRKNDLEVMQKGIIKEAIEEEILLPDGKKAIFSSTKEPFYDESGKVVGLIGVSVNITELKRAQENEKLALQKVAAEEATKRALLIFSGMSTHDLRTPLSSISLRAAFLNKYIFSLVETYKSASKAGLEVAFIQSKALIDLPQVPEDILQGVREANEYIDASLKSLKAAAEEGGIINKDQLVVFNAERLLRRIIDNYPYKEGEKDLLHYDAECDFNFKGNMIFFNRLIENLIKNAFEQIHAKKRGEIFIECASQGSLKLIKIKDTAGDVTQELIDKLFKGIQSTKAGGTGIGLSSAKQIMQGMNGDIEAQLVEGDCIEFVLSFPSLPTN